MSASGRTFFIIEPFLYQMCIGRFSLASSAASFTASA